MPKYKTKFTGCSELKDKINSRMTLIKETPFGECWRSDENERFLVVHDKFTQYYRTDSMDEVNETLEPNQLKFEFVNQ